MNHEEKTRRLLLTFLCTLSVFLTFRLEVASTASTSPLEYSSPSYSLGNVSTELTPENSSLDFSSLEEESEEEDESGETSEEDDEDLPPTVDLSAVPMSTSTPRPGLHIPKPVVPSIVSLNTNSVSNSSPDSKSIGLEMLEVNATSKERGPIVVLPIRQKDEPGLYLPTDDDEDTLLTILQNSVRETYLAFKGNTARKKKEEIEQLEDSLKDQMQNLDIELNSKLLALDSTTNSRISTLTEQIVSQRKEDLLTFSDNLNQLSKANQVHLETLHAETQHLKGTVDAITKGQTNLSSKMSQLQKTIHSLETKINEITMKSTEDYAAVQSTQKTLAVLVNSMEKDLRSVETALTHVQGKIGDLEKAKAEDSNKLRKTLIRDQKQDPMQACVRHLRNKNVGGALKQWRMIEQITEDLKETLPSDMTKIIEDVFNKSPLHLPQIVDFIHRAVSHGERRLKEAAYSTLLNKLEQNKLLTDRRKILDIFNLAQRMKSDLGSYFNTSSSTAEIISKLPEAIRLVTFEKVKLVLPSRGYLRVSADKKVSLVPQDARFYDKEEILWLFEYDKDKTDGTFYIKSDKLQKYLVTIHEGFNSYGFSRQALFMTGNRKENGTRFDISNINGDHVLLKSIFYNGYLTWKSNIQTIYGDDDSYFVLIEDRKNGPSPYWIIEPENDFTM